MSTDSLKSGHRRRTYTAQFKVDMVAQCLQGDVPLASLAVEPMDMRAGPDTALARVVKDFGAAYPHHAYVLANKRANRMKILVHDGLGVWLAARRLNQGRFVWPRAGQIHVELSNEQLQALVIGLPWHRIGDGGIIDVV